MRRSALLAATILLGAAAPPPVPVYRDFGDWMVACDNTRTCHARGFDETTQAELDVTRPAGDAPATVDLNAADAMDPTKIKAGDTLLTFPGPAWTVAATSIHSSDPAAIAAFIAAVRNVDALSLGPVKDDDSQPAVSLKGFTAALLFMDAVGGRVGTPSPLIAERGTGTPLPPLPLPAAPKFKTPPPLSKAELERLLREARTLVSPDYGKCEHVDGDPEVHPLDARTALAIRPCYMAAYQGSSVVALLPRDGGKPVPLVLTLPGLQKDADGPDMVDPAFDPAEGLLATVSKGRGIADCGSDERWIWSDGAFRIAQFAFQDRCGGTEPGNWLTVFRSR